MVVPGGLSFRKSVMASIKGRRVGPFERERATDSGGTCTAEVDGSVTGDFIDCFSVHCGPLFGGCCGEVVRNFFQFRSFGSLSLVRNTIVSVPVVFLCSQEYLLYLLKRVRKNERWEGVVLLSRSGRTSFRSSCGFSLLCSGSLVLS